MNGGSRTYSIYKLGSTTDLDTVTALKKMPKSDYFDLLGEFSGNAPELIRIMKAEDLDIKSPACAEALDRLQFLTLGISSSSLIWKMAKLASSLNWGRKDAMAEAMMIVQKSVDALCAQICDAELVAPRAAGDEEKTAVPPPPAEAPAPAAESLRRVSLNPDIFEKTFLLVENGEFESALIDLQALRGFSYGEKVDVRLAQLLDDLRNRQYATAQTRVGALREFIAALSEAEHGTGRKKQILAIDDVPDVLRILQTGLRSRFDVVGVTNHMTALKYLSTHTADLILLDIEMPDMDGYTLLDIIRKLENYKKTPVLFLTGNASTEHVKMAIRHGGNDFIRKPVDLELLIGKITKHLADE